jgi:hypothetical protein
MPKGYVIFTEKISDLSGYGGYVRRALPTVVATGISPGLAAPVTRWPDEAVDDDLDVRGIGAHYAQVGSPPIPALRQDRHRVIDAHGSVDTARRSAVSDRPPPFVTTHVAMRPSVAEMNDSWMAFSPKGSPASLALLVRSRGERVDATIKNQPTSSVTVARDSVGAG